jgi:hypothetical protein
LAGVGRCLAQEQNPALHQVREIHVGTMGQGDEAERFRLLLGQELRRAGFRVAEKPENGDAILAGTVSVEVHGDETVARASVTLKTRSGKQLWFGDYFAQHEGAGPSDTLKVTAGNCADGLRKDWEKAGNPKTGQ